MMNPSEKHLESCGTMITVSQSVTATIDSMMGVLRRKNFLFVSAACLCH